MGVVINETNRSYFDLLKDRGFSPEELEKDLRLLLSMTVNCPMCIGNPCVTSHTPQCQQMRYLRKKYEKDKDTKTD